MNSMDKLDMAIKLQEVEEVLLLCVSGFTNQEIADYLRIDVEDIDIHIKSYLDFDGWKERLTFNPWFYYKYNKYLTDSEFCGIIKLCEKFEDYRKEIQ